jgi:hypothetical protein
MSSISEGAAAPEERSMTGSLRKESWRATSSKGRRPDRNPRGPNQFQPRSAGPRKASRASSRDASDADKSSSRGLLVMARAQSVCRPLTTDLGCRQRRGSSRETGVISAEARILLPTARSDNVGR